MDNCETTANSDQANNDGDADGDLCDTDDDDDGMLFNISLFTLYVIPNGTSTGMLPVSHICKRIFIVDSNFNEAVIEKISSIHEIAQISHIYKNRSFTRTIIGKSQTNCCSMDM